MSDHRKNEPFKKCRPIYTTHVLIGAISCNPALWEVWWQSFHNKKKILLFSLTSLLLPCAYERIRNRRRPVATQLEQIDESQSFFGCLLYLLLLLLSFLFFVVVVVVILFVSTGGTTEIWSRQKSKKESRKKKKGNPDNQSCIFVNALIT